MPCTVAPNVTVSCSERFGASNWQTGSHHAGADPPRLHSLVLSVLRQTTCQSNTFTPPYDTKRRATAQLWTAPYFRRKTLTEGTSFDGLMMIQVHHRPCVRFRGLTFARAISLVEPATYHRIHPPGNIASMDVFVWIQLPRKAQRDTKNEILHLIVSFRASCGYSFCVALKPQGSIASRPMVETQSKRRIPTRQRQRSERLGRPRNPPRLCGRAPSARSSAR